MNPILGRLPATAGLVGRTEGARMLGRAMPFCYSGAIALGLLWVVLGWTPGQGGAAAAAAALLVAAFVLAAVGLAGA